MKQKVASGAKKGKEILKELGGRMSKTLLNSATLTAASGVVAGVMAGTVGGVAISLLATAAITGAAMGYDSLHNK